MVELYIGIDPGNSGAICCTDNNRIGDVITTTGHPYHQIWDRLTDYIHGHRCVACIESVGSMPGQGVSSTFKFGQSYGSLLMLLSAAKIPFIKVRPATWCAEFGLKRKEKEKTSDWKNRHKAIASDLFPDVKISHAIADALLISEYCRRRNT